MKSVEEAARDEVWASYRFIALRDKDEPHGLKLIDLGAGHSSSSVTLVGRVIQALKGEALLNESVGTGYIERHWPPAFKESGAWPLTSLRQSFLDGSLTRLSDPDAVLRRQIVQFVGSGDFGLASGPKPAGGFERLWHATSIQPDEVAFEQDVLLLTRAAAETQKAPPEIVPPPSPVPEPMTPPPEPPTDARDSGQATLRLTGAIPPEVWNRLGNKVLPKLRLGEALTIGIDFSVQVDAGLAAGTVADLKLALDDLGISDAVRIERR